MSQIVFKSYECLNYYPNNKPNYFTVKIPNLASMGRNLEVALTEISFPSGFINVRDGYNQIDVILAMDETVKTPETMEDSEIYAMDKDVKVNVDKTTEDPIDEFSTVKFDGPILAPIYAHEEDKLTIDEITENARIKFKIEPDFYKPNSLIAAINSKLDKGMMEIELNDNNNKGWITMNRKIRVKFGMDIAKILGFNSGEWLTFGPEKTISPNQAGSYKNTRLLNVYCDTVEETLVGENHHPLLRIVNWNFSINNGFIFNPSIIYKRPYFIPVKNAEANSIEFRITDSLNIPVEFTGDEYTSITLEFRKKAD